MKLIQEKEIAAFTGTSSQNITHKKKHNPDQYELIRLGCICKKYDITEDKLALMIENDLDKVLQILGIVGK